MDHTQGNGAAPLTLRWVEQQRRAPYASKQRTTEHTGVVTTLGFNTVTFLAPPIPQLERGARRAATLRDGRALLVVRGVDPGPEPDLRLYHAEVLAADAACKRIIEAHRRGMPLSSGRACTALMLVPSPALAPGRSA